MPRPALGDLVVVDLSTMLPGQTCSMILGDLGARVITVERPGVGDYSRRAGKAGSFESVNRNKESITLDLKSPAGRGILTELITLADVVIEGFRPSAARRLAVDYPAVRQVSPAVVHCSISGYGDEGSSSELPGHDPNYLAVAGVLSLAGDPDGGPSADLGVSMADLAGAWFAAISILAAVRVRDRDGIGQHVEVALADASFALIQNRLSEALLAGTATKPAMMARPGVGLFRAADGEHLTIGAVEDHFWRALCTVVQAPDLLADERLQTTLQRRGHGTEIRGRLAREFARRPRDEWLERLRAADIPCAPVLDLREAADSEYARQRSLVEVIDHPALGDFRAVRFPARLSATPAVTRIRSPLLGEHTDAILAELGHSAAEIAVLRHAGAA